MNGGRTYIYISVKGDQLIAPTADMNTDEVMNQIPVRPNCENENQLKGIYQEKQMGLWKKTKQKNYC